MEYKKRKQFQKKESKYDSKLLDLARVAHTREGGRRMSFRAVMVIGDRRGNIGVGVASGSDVAKGVQKATRAAERNMIFVPTVNGTIPHQVEAKYSAARVLLKPQRKRRGLVAGGTVRVMCSLAGIEDISSKVLGTTRNKLNNARAVMRAFRKLRRVDTVKSSPKTAEVKKEVKEEVAIPAEKSPEKKVAKVKKEIVKKEVKKEIVKKDVKKDKKK